MSNESGFELGEVFEDMIFETLAICENEVVLVEQLIEVIAKSIDVTEEQINHELLKVDSVFTCNNPIQGFIWEKGKYKPYKRITIYAATKKILEKHLSNYPMDEKVQILQEINHYKRVQPLKFRSA